MLKFIVREILSSIFSMFIFLFLMYYFINILIPGDFLTPLQQFMSKQEVDELRESLGVNDPLYQRYFRWMLGIFNGEITTGGFRQKSGKDIISTFFPTMQILIPSFLLSFYISRIPSIKTPIKKLHKNKILSDTLATVFISLFPPIILFIIDSKFDNFYLFIVSHFSLDKTPTASLSEISTLKVNLFLFLLLVGITILVSSLIDLFTNLKLFIFKVSIFVMILIIFVLNIDLTYLNEIIQLSKNAFKTISILTIFFIGEYILLTNVITQNIAREHHILTAKALGFSNSKIFTKHILRNTFGPFATRIGLGLPFTISSLVIVESTTNWNGMGSLLYQTIMNQDSNAAMGLFLLLALLTIILRIVISLFQMIIDPRVRIK